MSSPTIIRFGVNQIEIFPDSTRITLGDGATILAMPEQTESYLNTANNTGYKGDTLRLCKDHELTHVALAHILGLAESPTMRMVTSNSGEQWIADAEEAAVLAIQRYANAVNVNLIDLFQHYARTLNERPILVSSNSI